ncbi:MAG: 1,6-anhydro-N-acetylmuramyl-L-alanine amidase AmpD [Pseudomonadales bacterium]
MRVKKNHCLFRVALRPSPNFSDRPDAEDIALIVIHGISVPAGDFDSGLVDALFTNTLPERLDPTLESLRGTRVSTHVFISRSGKLTQYVPFDKRAWHAGESSWRQRIGCNDFSVGIELEGTDQLPYTDAQYESLHSVTRALFARYPRLSADAVVGHQEVAPLRKTDPGPGFDWPRYLGALATI